MGSEKKIKEPKWIAEWREDIARENGEAINRSFDLGVANGRFPDNDETWRAYVHAWYGKQDFEYARRELSQAGDGWGGLTALSYVIGGMILTLAFAVLVLMPDRFVESNTAVLIPFGLGLLALGEVFRRRLKRATNKAGSEFKATWGSQSDG